MSEQREGAYTGDNLPEEEIERLRTFEYPNFVTREALSGIDLRGQSLLDIGAGSSPFLADYVNRRGGNYVPLDINRNLLGALKREIQAKEIPFFGVKADVRQLPFADNSVDFTHQRFVLMHLGRSIEEQVAAVAEAVRVARNKVVLLEFDWHQMHSTDDSAIIERLKTTAYAFMDKFKPQVDPFAGAKLAEVAKAAGSGFEVSAKQYLRPEGNYTPEIIGLSGSFSSIARERLKDEELASEFDSIQEILKSKPVNFVPPSIEQVIIEKKS